MPGSLHAQSEMVYCVSECAYGPYFYVWKLDGVAGQIEKRPSSLATFPMIRQVFVYYKQYISRICTYSLLVINRYY